jgi:DNA repair ATPase RecN
MSTQLMEVPSIVELRIWLYACEKGRLRMSQEPKTIKFQLMLSESEAKAIDDWGFKNRIRTRAEAIRRLTHIGATFDDRREAIRSGVAKVALPAGEVFPLAIEMVTKNENVDEDTVRLAHAIMTITKSSVPLLALIRAVNDVAKSSSDSSDEFDRILEDSATMLAQLDTAIKESSELLNALPDFPYELKDIEEAEDK